MIRNTLLSLFLFFIVLNGFSQEEKNHFFTEGTLRYDFEFVGNADTFWIAPVQQKKLNSYVGNPGNAIEGRDMGVYRFILYDIPSGMQIFKKGFNPLFQEWLQTSEAKKMNRSFYQALYFPMPVNNVQLSIDIRNTKNKWVRIYSDTINVSSYKIKNELPLAFPVNEIYKSGEPSDKIDIAILSEGYTKKELKKFRSDTRKMVDSIMNGEPFKSCRDRFNFYAVNVPSAESGCDMPADTIYKNTAFNSNFDTFDSQRYLTTSDYKSVCDAADNVPWDYIIILVNTKRYGGGGFYNFLSITSVDNPRSWLVFIHEFGHSFAGLGDEYYNSGDNPDPSYLGGSEPWEPNLTSLVDFDSKWKKMVEPGTPIPTPRDSVYKNKVGAFEGGGYTSKGVFSPVMTCWMKELSAGRFCPVCQEAIKQTILEQTK
ncbi:MAG TPA: M64 family metallopeptidase [Prolixibacteraceae bacterium]|nr:M64 family metallopeptidase [Prolixibacteraceae bacterium]